jgi:hypothetical protein
MLQFIPRLKSWAFLNPRRKECARFVLAFFFLGFLMKVVGELIHEMGHVLFVTIFGGKIIGISIGFAWPFALSSTKWELANPSNMEIAMIASAGILFDVVISFAGQAILVLRKRIRPVYRISLFWLSFWTYLSSVVYLVMGAIDPFGDILNLVGAVPIPLLAIGLAGVVLLLSNTYSLSIILKGIFSDVLGLREASDMVSIFWAALHMFFVLTTIVKFGLPTPPTITATVLVVIFIWSYITVRWLLVFVSRLTGSREKQELPPFFKPGLTNSSVDGEARHRRERLVYVALFSVALVSILLTGYMINQYLSTYSLVIKTSIEVEVTDFDLYNEQPSLYLSVKVYNPTHDNMTLKRLEFDVKLNQKFIDHQVLRYIPQAAPESRITFDHIMIVPSERMFTVEQAIKDRKWEWTISGSGYINTLFGETLLRFSSESNISPN